MTQPYIVIIIVVIINKGTKIYITRTRVNQLLNYKQKEENESWIRFFYKFNTETVFTTKFVKERKEKILHRQRYSIVPNCRQNIGLALR